MMPPSSSGFKRSVEPIVVAPKPVPKIERMSVLLRYAGRWSENGETRTSGPHTTVALPVETARLALEHNHAVLVDGQTERTAACTVRSSQCATRNGSRARFNALIAWVRLDDLLVGHNATWPPQMP